jgi:hypothetical protein
MEGSDPLAVAPERQVRNPAALCFELNPVADAVLGRVK